MITYRYLSDGTKVSAEAVLQPDTNEGNGYAPARIYRRRYKGNFTYVTDPDTGEETLESISWREGRITIATEPEPALRYILAGA